MRRKQLKRKEVDRKENEWNPRNETNNAELEDKEDDDAELAKEGGTASSSLSSSD